MNRRVLSAVTAATVILGAPVLAQDTSPSAEQRAANVVASSPEEFAEMAAISDLFEIESSRLALEKAQLDEVREFAQRMIDDHTKASADMRAAAEAEGVTDIPQALDARHQALMTQLHEAAADEFDSRYLEIQVIAHLEAQKLFSSYAGAKGELAEFAEETLPTIEEHRAIAVDLAG